MEGQIDVSSITGRYKRFMENGPFFKCQFCGDEYVVKFTGKCLPCRIKDEESKRFQKVKEPTLQGFLAKYKEPEMKEEEIPF